ncbi:hypothetical protein [Coleofasciculus sp. E2-BRE-01]|uniref:hypothetical protein n=1 Tax=unclassified Coleofasciculus TaxID=2692782 RepID=UPI0032F69988
MFYLLPMCALLFGGGLVSCSYVPTPPGMGSAPTANLTAISEIQSAQNARDVVYLQGQVISQAPFLNSGAYQVQDTTGKIWVVSNQELPNVGDQVVIGGQVQFQSIPISGQEMGELYLQETEQIERKAE